MPLDDPRLICPRCGKLVEIEVERFEDLFEEPLEPGDEVLPTYHPACAPPPRTHEEWLAALEEEEPPSDSPRGWTAYRSE